MKSLYGLIRFYHMILIGDDVVCLPHVVFCLLGDDVVLLTSCCFLLACLLMCLFCTTPGCGVVGVLIFCVKSPL